MGTGVTRRDVVPKQWNSFFVFILENFESIGNLLK